MLARFVVYIYFIGVGFLTPMLSAQIVDTVCAGTNGESYFVNQHPGSTYNWSLKGGVITAGNGSNKIQVNWGMDTGIFQLNVIEHNYGCPGDTVRAFVYIRQGIDVNILGPKFICPGEQVTLFAEGSPDMVWNTGQKGQTIQIRPHNTQTYFVVGEALGCGIDTAWFTLQVFQKPKAEFLINPYKPKLDDLVNFHYSGKNEAKEIQWVVGNPLDETGKTISYTFNTPGNYEVQMILIDTNGCADTAIKQVLIEQDVHVYIPDAFTPNSDGLNTVFAPVCSGVKAVKLQVYDRWGELVYSGEGLDLGWDGTYKGNAVPDGVYAYVVSATGENNKKYFYNGTVTVLR